jgi:hypothetical protein
MPRAVRSSCGACQRHDLLGREGLGRLGVVLASFVGPPSGVRRERERVGARRVLENVHESLAVRVDAPTRQSLAVQFSEKALDLRGADLGDTAVAEGAHDPSEALTAVPWPLAGW